MACSGDSVLTSYEDIGNSQNNIGYTSPYYSQSFIVPNDATICGLSFYGGKGTVGTQPGTYKFEILDAINGTVLATTGSLNSSDLSDYTPSPAWYKKEFSSTVSLTASTTYYLRCTALTGSTNDVLRWFIDTTSPTYSDGTGWQNTTQQTGWDHTFRIHGVEAAATDNALFMSNF